MISEITRLFKSIWDSWNLRGAILFSLSLQTFLVFFATFRKRASKDAVFMLIWITYLLADWVASFSVGLIAKSHVDRSGHSHDHNLLTFWAPFLLLHLGGPDTITSFSLEDNELWLRHLLGLIVEVIAVAYVYYEALSTDKVRIPAGLVFLSGVIKYGERTRALFLASIDRFRDSLLTPPDPGPNYAKLMDEYSSRKEANLPATIVMIPEKDSKTNELVMNNENLNFGEKANELDDIKMVQEAHRFFNTFKGLLVDIIFSFHERNASREFFHKRSAEYTLRLLEVELNFFYDVLYTKVIVVRGKLGYSCRFICLSSVMAAATLFFFMDKNGFQRIDVEVTYILLIGALVLDASSFLQLIFSDWTVSGLKSPPEHWVLAAVFKAFLSLKRSTWPDGKQSEFGFLAWLKRFLFRRWSQSISRYNLIHYSIQERPRKIQTIFDHMGFLFSKIIVLLGLKDLLDHMRYSSHAHFTKELWNFIHGELLEKSKLADVPVFAKRIYSARGDWVLQDRDWSKLMPFVVDTEYDESLILWHVATELCYNTEKSSVDDEHKEFCKTLSDYMLYLLVVQPAMMTSIAGIGRIRFRDTCAEAKKFLSGKELSPGKEQIQACTYILAVNTSVKPVDVKGDRSKSVLFDASRLAKELKEFDKDKWKIMGKVWVELLSYAASHCRATAHAHRLSKGGELATFVWLLMAHYGLGEQFQINEGQARAKLVVGK